MKAAQLSHEGREPLLQALPPEILHNILSSIRPDDLDTVSQLSRFFHDFVKGNQTLCRGIYLNHLDTPPKDAKLDWKAELRDLLKLTKLLERAQLEPQKEFHQLPFVYDTVTRVLQHASLDNETQTSRNVDHLDSVFDMNDMGPSVFMQQSSLFERIRRGEIRASPKAPPTSAHQMSAKLHCLYGSPMMQAGRTRSARTYPWACSLVYDLRQYTQRTKWGPFRDDETGWVDWEKLEAIAIVLGKNIRYRWPGAQIFEDIFDSRFFGSFPHSFAYRDGEGSEPDFGTAELDAQDPYGVTGYWYRVVCFLDYSDFFHYNFSMNGLVPPNTLRPPLNVGEAARIIILKVHVTEIESPGEDDHPDWPVVHYTGDSRALDDRFDESALSRINGTVRMTKEGEVRWSSVSVFDGQERWRSEGVQVGGVKSARGVWGNWFDKDFDPHGPAGPTAFWKASDSAEAAEAMQTGLSAIVVDPFGHGRYPAGLATAMEVGDLDDFDDMDFVNDEEDDDWDEEEEQELLAGLHPLLTEEIPRLLAEREIGEAELALIRQQLGLEE